MVEECSFPLHVAKELLRRGDAERKVEGRIVRVDLLYFDGCASYRVAEERVRKVLALLGLDSAVELIPVETEEEARRLRFPSSPTIRIDGADLFTMGGADAGMLGCRVYRTPEGLVGSPTEAMIAEAFDRLAARHSTRP